MTNNEFDSQSLSQGGARRSLGLGIALGLAISVLALLPATLNALTGASLLAAVAEAGPVVVLVLLGIAVVVWALTDLVPGFRARTIKPGLRREHLRQLTQTPRRALFVGAIAGLLFGLLAMQAVGAAADGLRPGTAPRSNAESEKGLGPVPTSPYAVIYTQRSTS